jgi:replicative DNA helicase
MVDPQHGQDSEQFGDLLSPYLDEVEAAYPHGGAHIQTSFSDLDRLLGGVRGGQLVVVGGRPAMGKTVLAFDVIRQAAFRQNLPAAIFTREMNQTEVMNRLVSAEARIPTHVLRLGLLSDDDWTRLARVVEAISEAPLFIDARVRTMDEIRAKARRLRLQHGLRIIVVDYIQLFANGIHDRYREVADVSRSLKDLARELDIAVIAVSQLNRASQNRTDRRPVLADLRDSGTVEDDADVVIFVHRDDYYDRESPRAGEADLIVAKHRYGPTDTITVAAQLHLSRMVDMAPLSADEEQLTAARSSN